ncbi:hypothetical protein C8F01DRAFT_1261325 [Mycena amicta]|nr:hypothetical protein C8F01DRAFT_1261325 [Mycena amicta]
MSASHWQSTARIFNHESVASALFHQEFERAHLKAPAQNEVVIVGLSRGGIPIVRYEQCPNPALFNFAATGAAAELQAYSNKWRYNLFDVFTFDFVLLEHRVLDLRRKGSLVVLVRDTLDENDCNPTSFTGFVGRTSCQPQCDQLVTTFHPLVPANAQDGPAGQPVASTSRPVRELTPPQTACTSRVVVFSPGEGFLVRGFQLSQRRRNAILFP